MPSKRDRYKRTVYTCTTEGCGSRVWGPDSRCRKCHVKAMSQQQRRSWEFASEKRGTQQQRAPSSSWWASTPRENWGQTAQQEARRMCAQRTSDDADRA